jgi:hypothetical protein
MLCVQGTDYGGFRALSQCTHFVPGFFIFLMTAVVKFLIHTKSRTETGHRVILYEFKFHIGEILRVIFGHPLLEHHGPFRRRNGPAAVALEDDRNIPAVLQRFPFVKNNGQIVLAHSKI